MSKHTPGPWELDGVEVYPVDGLRALDAICEMSPGQGDERFYANARLIVAAPILLEALIDCVRVMQRDLNGLAVIQPELRQAIAALAKAGAEA